MIYVTGALIFGILGFIYFYLLVFSQFIAYFTVDGDIAENLYFYIIFVIIIFLLFQCPAILIYYHYKLNIKIISDLKTHYQEGENIELEVQVIDSSGIISIAADISVNWPAKVLETRTDEKSYFIKLETEDLVGENQLQIRASKSGNFSSRLVKEIVIL